MKQLYINKARLLTLCPIFILLLTASSAYNQILSSELDLNFLYQDTVQLNRINKKLLQHVIEGADSLEPTLQKSIWINKNFNYVPGIVKSLNTMALYQMRMGKAVLSAQYYTEAIKLAEQKPNEVSSTQLASLNANLVHTYYALKQYDKAQYFLDKVYVFAQRNQSHELLFNYFLGMSAVKASLNQKNEALELALKAYSIAKKNISDFNEALEALYLSSTSLATIYAEMGKTNECKNFINKAQESVGKTNKFYRDKHFFVLAQCYHILKEYDKAIKYVDIGLSKYKTRPNKDILIASYSLLADAYSKKKDYKNALHYYDLYNQLNDSLRNKDVIAEVHRHEIQYQSEKKDKELAQQKLLNSEKEALLKIQTLWSYGLGIFLLFVVTASGLWVVLLRRKKSLKEKEILLKLQHQQIDHFHSIIDTEEKERKRIGQDLHDGIGGLVAAINMNLKTILQKDNIKPYQKEFILVERMLQEASEEIRKTAHNLIPDVLMNHTLIEAIALYCDRINQSGKIRINLYTHNVSDNIEKHLSMTLYRIIQELIQNVLKHAFANQATLQVRQIDATLSICLEDNGIGFKPENIVNGLGLKNIQERLSLLGGNLHIESNSKSGTVVFVELQTENTSIDKNLCC